MKKDIQFRIGEYLIITAKTALIVMLVLCNGDNAKRHTIENNTESQIEKKLPGYLEQNRSVTNYHDSLINIKSR